MSDAATSSTTAPGPQAASPWRGDFDLPADRCWLNTSFMAPLLHVVAEAGRAGLDLRSRPWDLSGEHFFGPAEEVRTLTAGLLGGTPGDWALVPSVSYGIETAALNLPLAAGQKVVVVDEQFPSNIYPWRAVAGRAGARVHAVQRPADDDWAAAIEASLGEDTAVVAVPAVHWTTGAGLDLHAISAAARRRGAALVVDATQGAGVMPLDAAALDADFLVTASYKYLLGPYGLCVLYVAPRHQQGRPLEHGWLNRQGSDRFDRLTDYTDTYRPGARRFDQGERADPVHLSMAIAALQWLTDQGPARLAEHTGGLLSLAADLAAEAGIGTPTRGRLSPMMAGLELPPGTPDGFADHLREQGVFVNSRGSRVRFSLHAHNGADDVRRFFEVFAASR